MIGSDSKKNESGEGQQAAGSTNFNQSGGSTGYPSRREYSSAGGSGYGGGYEKPKAGAMEVHVEHNIEKAMRVLKRKLIKEGLFKELKSRRYYEKPSERRKRKEKESQKKARKEEARQRKNPVLFS